MHWLMVAGHGSSDVIDALEAGACLLIAAGAAVHALRPMSVWGRMTVCALLSTSSTVLWLLALLFWHHALPDAPSACGAWRVLRPETVGACASLLATGISLASRRMRFLRPLVFPWYEAQEDVPVLQMPAAAPRPLLYPPSRAYLLSVPSSPPPPYHPKA